MGELAKYGALAGLGQAVAETAKSRAQEIRDQRMAQYQSGLRREEAAEDATRQQARDERLHKQGTEDIQLQETLRSASQVQEGQRVSERELARDKRTAERERQSDTRRAAQDRESDLRERETRESVARIGRTPTKPVDRFERTTSKVTDEETGIEREVGVVTDAQSGRSYAEKKIGQDIWWVPFASGSEVTPDPDPQTGQIRLPGPSARQYLKANPSDWPEFLRVYGVLPPEFFSGSAAPRVSPRPPKSEPAEPARSAAPERPAPAAPSKPRAGSMSQRAVEYRKRG